MFGASFYAPMDVVPEGTSHYSSAGFGDPGRPHTRNGGSRSRPLSRGLSWGTRVSSLTFGEMRGGLGSTSAQAVSPSRYTSASELASTSRPTFNDGCLSSIGLPGEEAATFEPLFIEPYEPAASVASPHAAQPTTIFTATACMEPPPGPLTPSTAAPIPSATQLSPTATSACAFTTVPSAGTVLQPRPPPGSALQRNSSCRRSLIRQNSLASTGTGSVHTIICASGPSPPSSTASTPGSAAGAAMPATPRIPPPTAVDTAMLPPPPPPPPPVLSIPEVPVLVFDSSAVSVVCGGGGAGGSSTGAVTVMSDCRVMSSFLEPLKPAVRRLLPPLLRASQVLQDNQVLQDSGTELSPLLAACGDDGALGTCNSLVALSSRCNGGGGGSSNVSPSSGVGPVYGGGLDAELQEELLIQLQLQPPPPPVAIDLHDLPSPRGRRALPPMDPLRSSTLSATSMSEVVDATEPPLLELLATPSESYLTTHACVYDAPSSAPISFSPSTRRGGAQLHVSWDTDAASFDPRVGAALSSDTGEALTTDSGAFATVLSISLQRTASFHAVSCSNLYLATGAGGGGGTANSISCGGNSGGSCNNGLSPVLLDGTRLRVRCPVALDSSLMAMSCGGTAGSSVFSVGGGNSAADGIGGMSARARNRTSLTNLPLVGPTRVKEGGAMAAAAALPPILDRGGKEIDTRWRPSSSTAQISVPPQT